MIETGDRKDGSATDHVARQYLASVGKIDNGIVAVTTLWASEERYYPLHVMPYTPGKRLAGGSQDPAFRTKPQIALDLVGQAQAADHSFKDAAQALPLSAWQPVIRRFQGGHTERWWAAELTLFGYGPDKVVRAVCATTDRRELPALSTWYLTTNVPAPLEDIVRLYGLRNWVEQSYKQMKDELGWADFMVRSDRAIRRHWTLVCCAFSFCWWVDACQGLASDSPTPLADSPITPPEAGGENRQPQVLAAPAARGARLADPGLLACALLGRLCQRAPASRTRRAARRLERRPRNQSLPSDLTNYR